MSTTFVGALIEDEEVVLGDGDPDAEPAVITDSLPIGAMAPYFGRDGAQPHGALDRRSESGEGNPKGGVSGSNAARTPKSAGAQRSASPERRSRPGSSAPRRSSTPAAAAAAAMAAAAAASAAMAASLTGISRHMRGGQNAHSAIERVVGRATNDDGTVRYKVRWAGTDEAEDEWFTRETMLQSPEPVPSMVMEFDVSALPNVKGSPGRTCVSAASHKAPASHRPPAPTPFHRGAAGCCGPLVAALPWTGSCGAAYCSQPCGQSGCAGGQRERSGWC